jgi:DNA-directed RNA polymerase specialized sigma24 family protein
MEVVKTDPISIEKIREKDINTIIDWFDTKKDLYYKFILFYLNEPREYEEVFYRVIMKVYDEIHQIKSRSSFDTWVISILIDECLEMSANATQVIISVSNGDLLNKLSAMDDDYKSPIVLRYLMKMTNEEVAQILQVPVSIVKSRLFSGIQLLQNVWEDVGCEEYQDRFLDYLDMTLERGKRVELEIHIRTCKSCNNMLFDLEEVILTLSRESDDLEMSRTLMDGVIERVKNSIKEREQLKKNRMKLGTVIASLLTIAIFVGFFTNSFNNVYYTLLGWYNLEDEEISPI